MSKLTQWYDSLPAHTKTYLSNQPIWQDSDLIKFTTIAFIVGFTLGALLWM
ncbi:hypothetical protein UFOVP181_137 [uncultured Caudovirales phage]|uniref:Uncharacterized protein n=1 Tax=uncultured Caudovirales phage TaxID=2100421 RepID=A0A6J7WDE1_9CAUD|nr:hypothetical protein UFOVP57_25 [uncultured Caudovirales phage]CAB5208738.1 hypothetical protein UFOVP181_137 [uncultured Caudovirales phage]